MKRTLFLIGALAMVLPSVAFAQQDPGIYDMFYDEAETARADAKPSEPLGKYIIKEMEHWQTRGIVLTEEDLKHAINNADKLCQDKVDMEGKKIEFDRAGTDNAGSCWLLQQNILGLMQYEQSVDQLSSDLVSIANGAELAVADEPHRPIDMARVAMTLRRVWMGTGAAVIPWNGDADSELGELENHLKDADDKEKIVIRFRHGYFRDQREQDPRFQDIGTEVKDDLKKIADKLKISGDPTVVGTFSVPKLKVPNIGLWIRKDDIGLMWVYPSKSVRFKYEPAKTEYPKPFENGQYLAYPFAYEGSAPPSGAGITSPVCSRTMGRQGYLCRALPPLSENCARTGDESAISLTKCSEGTSQTVSGPLVCPGFDKLFKDTGIPLADPNNPGRLNPALQPADTAALCTPETRTLYQDDITSHACYIGHCLTQSMTEGNTLIPNRNTVVLNEATSPYLACQRIDPQVGMYTEVAKEGPYPLPEYLGQFLVRDFDKQYCASNGNAPESLPSLCRFLDNQTAALPDYIFLFQAMATSGEQGRTDLRRIAVNEIASAIGQRVAVDQSIEVQQKIFARLAHFVQQVADLVLELDRAPVTQTACPWTGPFETVTPF